MSKEHDDTSWSINTFVKNNDFTNKTVISFCTSLSSPLGESNNFLKEMTTGGTWLEEKRFYHTDKFDDGYRFHKKS